VYARLSEYNTSLKYLNEAELLAKKINSEQILLATYASKVFLYKKQRRPEEALAYAELYQKLKDKSRDASLTNRILSLQSQYELITKNQQIQLLQQEKSLQQKDIEVAEAKVRQQRLIISYGVIGLFLVIGTAAILYRSNEKIRSLNKQIYEQKEEISAQAEELMESSQAISKINESLELKVKERTSELQQAYKELDTFFYRSSHDFRRPLTTFMGLSEVAKVTVKDSNALELFSKVNETARSLDKMLSKLQSISDMGSQQLIYKEVFIKEIFENECVEYSYEINTRGIKTYIEADIKTPFYSYPALIRIAVSNLIENAIYFCQPANPYIKLSAVQKADVLELSVEDNGQGIAEEYIPRIFEMYFRGNENSKGNGLGLYIVKKVVEKLKGQLSVSSHQFKGTTVTVTLPWVGPPS
jgi:signal transduction histidine kinase